MAQPVSTAALIAAAGRGERLGADRPKALVKLAGRPLVARAVAALAPFVTRTVVAVPAGWEDAFRAVLPQAVLLVTGGARRQDSVARALAAVPAARWVLVHDAARPLVSPALVGRVLEAARRSGAAVPVLPVTETLKRLRPGEPARVAATVPREEYALSQTPQGFSRELLAAALAAAEDRGLTVSDEAAAVEALGREVTCVPGDPANLKITTPADLALAGAWLGREGGGGAAVRVGFGWDLHRLAAGRPLVLGSVVVATEQGAVGHSDGDVLLHAVTDALLGAAGLPDLGELFDDRDPRWAGAPSRRFLAEALARVRAAGWMPVQVDAVLHLERPRLGPHKEAIRRALAALLALPPAAVGLKAKTGEGLGPVGRGEAVAAQAVVLLAAVPPAVGGG